MVLMFVAVLLLGGLLAFAVTANKKETPAERIDRLGREMAADKAEAVRRAKKLGIPVRETYSDGRTIELMRFDGDRPVFYTTDQVTHPRPSAPPVEVNQTSSVKEG